MENPLQLARCPICKTEFYLPGTCKLCERRINLIQTQIERCLECEYSSTEDDNVKCMLFGVLDILDCPKKEVIHGN